MINLKIISDYITYNHTVGSPLSVDHFNFFNNSGTHINLMNDIFLPVIQKKLSNQAILRIAGSTNYVADKHRIFWGGVNDLDVFLYTNNAFSRSYGVVGEIAKQLEQLNCDIRQDGNGQIIILHDPFKACPLNIRLIDMPMIRNEKTAFFLNPFDYYLDAGNADLQSYIQQMDDQVFVQYLLRVYTDKYNAYFRTVDDVSTTSSKLLGATLQLLKICGKDKAYKQLLDLVKILIDEIDCKDMKIKLNYRQLKPFIPELIDPHNNQEALRLSITSQVKNSLKTGL